MATKKKVCFLEAVQVSHVGWRAEVTKVGNGPTRVFHAKALEDLTLAQQHVLLTSFMKHVSQKKDRLPGQI